ILEMVESLSEDPEPRRGDERPDGHRPRTSHPADDASDSRNPGGGSEREPRIDLEEIGPHGEVETELQSEVERRERPGKEQRRTEHARRGEGQRNGAWRQRYDHVEPAPGFARDLRPGVALPRGPEGVTQGSEMGRQRSQWSIRADGTHSRTVERHVLAGVQGPGRTRPASRRSVTDGGGGRGA